MRPARAVALWLLLSPSLCAAAAIHVAGQGMAAKSCDGAIEATRSCAAARCETLTFPMASLAGDVHLPAGRWNVVLQSSRCWAPAVSAENDAATPLPVWRKAELTGTIAADDRDHAALRADFLFPEDAGASRRSSVSAECAVTKTRWRCPAPAATFMLRLSLDGRAPHYVPHVALAASEQKNLGAVAFARGASVAGMVIPRDRRNGAVVELTPASPSATPRHPALYDAGEGLFQFTGLPPGIYKLAVKRPGWLPAERSGIQVEGGRESFLARPVQLERAATVDLLITPPLSASGQPWRVKLEKNRAGGSMTTVVESAASPSGAWHHEALHAGSYTISVQDAGGADFLRQAIEAVPDAEPRFLNIARIAVRGTVQAAKRPFASHLVFFDDDGSKIGINTDAAGRFEGVLPHDGDWQVQIRDAAETFYVRKSAVAVKRASAEAVADVAIALPGGQAKGRVVNEAGEPMEADVMVFQNGKFIGNVVSQPGNGTFQMIGVEPSAMTLQALSESAGQSDIVSYVAAEDDPASADLVLHKIVEVRGRLVSADGEPLAGAVIRYTAASMPRPQIEHSDPGGEFALRVPGTTRQILAVIAVPEFPSVIVALDGQRTDVQQVVLGNAAAVLHVVHATDTRWPYITLDRQLFLPVTTLMPLGPAGLVGLVADGLEVRIAPGLYTICEGGRDGCQPAKLAAGETLTFHAGKEISK